MSSHSPQRATASPPPQDLREPLSEVNEVLSLAPPPPRTAQAPGGASLSDAPA
ncbi:hypothetical protein BD779DRAFT_1538930 [Infundibulicybe gibba]|nr:hypothetical protein BD779DRAFT_1538930 [Infundibulicybe gibba]